jgi:hypothetical protein
MLKQLRDAAFADEAVKGMVVEVSTYSRNAADLFARRAKIARRIESLSASLLSQWLVT